MSNDDSKIEHLKQRLFSNSGEALPHTPRSQLQKHSVVTRNEWAKDEDSDEFRDDVKTFDVNDMGSGMHHQSSTATLASKNPTSTSAPEHVAFGMDLKESNEKQPMSPLKKILGFVTILFFLALGFAGYVFFTGSNFVSNANIDIGLVGPVTTPAGEEVSLDVDITNRNATDLVLVDLVIVYPEGTRRPDDKVTPLLTERIAIGTIAKGQRIRQTVKAILFGEENSKKNIKISLEYRIEGSSNIFVKEKSFPMFIGSSPITVNVDVPKEITPEQEQNITVTIKSNSSSVIKGLIFKAEYPFGFDFVSSIPDTTSGDATTWILGDLMPSEERRITIRGRILGGNEQERVFNFYTGTEDATDKTNIGTVFVKNTSTLVIKKPFLGVDLALDGKSDAIYVAEAGDDIRGEITWQNNLKVPLNDVVIEARITGDMLSRTAVKADKGFYRSTDGVIVWDKSTLAGLAQLDAGEVGRVLFNFSSLKPTTDVSSTYRKQTMKVELSVRAKRLNEDNVPDEIASGVTKLIRISTNLSLKPTLVRSIGPFENTGAVPPVAEKPTTYTMLVSVKNSFNNIKDAVYTATLPQYVEWMGLTYPNTNGVTYSKEKRQLTWQLGDVLPGVGYSSSAKEFAFKVSFMPSLGQIGSAPDIVVDQKIVGKDTFTGNIIETRAVNATTKTEDDPAYKFDQDKVVGP